MTDDMVLSERPSAAEVEANRAAIVAFRSRHQFSTKIDLAIAFVRERGTATSSELHLLMELAPGDSASNYLAGATKNGRLTKDGKSWSLGPNAPEPATALSWPSTKPAAQAADEKQEQATPEKSVEVAQEREQPVPGTVQPTRPHRYRYAKWSDGQVEIQRNNVPLVTLPREVAEDFARFMAE